MKALTYDEWKDLGYQVRRGEKANGRNLQGKATFNRDQVEEREDFDRQNNLQFERD
jgi:hypothetical protein